MIITENQNRRPEALLKFLKMLLGGGFICAALGILFMLLTILLVTKVVPAIFQGIAAIYNSIFGKKKGAAI